MEWGTIITVVVSVAVAVVTILALMFRLGVFGGGLKTDITWLKESVGSLNSKVDRIIERLPGTAPQSNTENFGGNSPLTLTPRGVELINQWQAEKLVEKYLSRVKDKLPNDAHKMVVQDTCFQFARFELVNIVEKSEREKLLDQIFEERGNPDDVLVIYGILFRDAIFKKRGIPVPERIESSKV